MYCLRPHRRLPARDLLKKDKKKFISLLFRPRNEEAKEFSKKKNVVRLDRIPHFRINALTHLSVHLRVALLVFIIFYSPKLVMYSDIERNEAPNTVHRRVNFTQR